MRGRRSRVVSSTGFSRLKPALRTIRTWNFIMSHHKGSLRRFTVLLFVLPLGCQRTPAAPPEEETHAAPVEAVAARTLHLGEWTELLGSTQPLPQRVARVTAPLEGRVL